MNIEQLIRKFYEGESTPEEEQFLTAYFLNEENTDERWKDERQLFRLLHDTQIQVPKDVSERLETSIRQMTAPPPATRKSLSRRLYYWTGSAAAVALLCIGLYFTTRPPSPPTMADTFSDPEEAALVAHRTLAFVSAHLNSGLNKVAEAEQELEKVNQILNKTFK